jgi:hypothetical protein
MSPPPRAFPYSYIEGFSIYIWETGDAGSGAGDARMDSSFRGQSEGHFRFIREYVFSIHENDAYQLPIARRRDFILCPALYGA